jgi:uncharacterized protein
MYEAVWAGNLPVIELLHKGYGADIFTVADCGSTLLHAAVLAQVPFQPVLLYLLRSGLDINALNSLLGTPLLVAASIDNAVAVQLLLEHGADPSITDCEGHAAIRTACRNGYADVVELLLSSGVQASATIDAEELTPLLVAVASGHTEVVKVLLQHGAAVHAETSRGMTALMAAAICDHNQCMQLLIDAGADVHVRNEQYISVLFAAASGASEQCVQLLLDAGADASDVTPRGSTILHAAICVCVMPVVTLHVYLANAGDTI